MRGISAPACARLLPLPLFAVLSWLLFGGGAALGKTYNIAFGVSVTLPGDWAAPLALRPGSTALVGRRTLLLRAYSLPEPAFVVIGLSAAVASPEVVKSVKGGEADLVFVADGVRAALGRPELIHSLKGEERERADAGMRLGKQVSAYALRNNLEMLRVLSVEREITAGFRSVMAGFTAQDASENVWNMFLSAIPAGGLTYELLIAYNTNINAHMASEVRYILRSLRIDVRQRYARGIPLLGHENLRGMHPEIAN